jgi:hypothetical protein
LVSTHRECGRVERERDMASIYEAGDCCVYCGEDTSFGSGRFVNRISASVDVASSYIADEPEAADFIEVEGFACAECMEQECDGCDQPIALDDDYRTEHGVYHYTCLTPNLMAEHAALYASNEEDAEEMIAEFSSHYEAMAQVTPN